MGNMTKTEQPPLLPEARWTIHKSVGEVPLTTLAEDDEQPRWVIVEDDEENLALVADIAENGVYENLIVTPRHLAPWVKVKPEEEDCFFVIVAGHRRNWASKQAGKTHAPIEVRIYENEDAYRKESVGTNQNRKALSPIEEAYVIYDWRNPKNGGEKVPWERIAVRMSMTVPTCRKRYKLTQLAKEIQFEYLHPKIPRKDQLGLNLAERLANLGLPDLEQLKAFADFHQVLHDFNSIKTPRDLLSAAQIIWLKVVKGKGLTDQRAIQMIDRGIPRVMASTPTPVNQRPHGGSGAGRVTRVPLPSVDSQPVGGSGLQKHEPARMHDVLQNYWKAVNEGRPMDWTQDDFDRAYQSMNKVQVEADLEEFRDIFQMLKMIIERIETTRGRKKS